MTLEEVEQIMSSFLQGTNFRQFGNSKRIDIIGSKKKSYELEPKPDDNGNIILKNCAVFRHCDACKNDSDWAIVCFNSGKVVWTEFAPD